MSRLLFSVIAASGLLLACSSAPKLTDAERRARATVTVTGDAKAIGDVVTDFLLAEGFAIDKFDAATGFISTGWKQKFSSGVSAAVGVKFEDRVQAKLRPAGESTAVEFWIFSRADDDGQVSDVEADLEDYDELAARFRSYVAERGLTTTSP